MLLEHATDSRTQKADAADLLRMDDDRGGAPRQEPGVPLHQAVASAEPPGAYRAARFPASVSPARKRGSEGAPQASTFLQTG